MDDRSSADTSWSEVDWLPRSDREPWRPLDFVAIGLAVLGVGAYVAGQLRVGTLDGVMLTLVGLTLWSCILGVVLFSHPYRLVGVRDLRIVFHVSSAWWDIGQEVRLEAARCRRRQAIAEGRQRRLARLVYFFPHRPTENHRRSVTLAGGRRATRYLYELELLQPIERVYRRGAAMATPADPHARVVGRAAADVRRKRGPVRRRDRA